MVLNIQFRDGRPPTQIQRVANFSVVAQQFDDPTPPRLLINMRYGKPDQSIPLSEIRDFQGFND